MGTYRNSVRAVANVPIETAAIRDFMFSAKAILVAAGIALALNMKSRIAAVSIGTLATALTLFLYVPILILAYRGGSVPVINEGINYVADTLLFAGSALALASALPDGTALE